MPILGRDDLRELAMVRLLYLLGRMRETAALAGLDFDDIMRREMEMNRISRLHTGAPSKVPRGLN